MSYSSSSCSSSSRCNSFNSESWCNNLQKIISSSSISTISTTWTSTTSSTAKSRYTYCTSSHWKFSTTLNDCNSSICWSTWKCKCSTCNSNWWIILLNITIWIKWNRCSSWRYCQRSIRSISSYRCKNLSNSNILIHKTCFTICNHEFICRYWSCLCCKIINWCQLSNIIILDSLWYWCKLEVCSIVHNLYHCPTGNISRCKVSCTI